jgi:TonB family protein
MNLLWSIFLSAFLLFPIWQNNPPDASQWWGEAKALGQKAASLKKDRREAYGNLYARIQKQVENELREKPSARYNALYDDLMNKAAPEFAVIKKQYDPQVAEALRRYVGFLEKRVPVEGEIQSATAALRPEILYQEKAKYTEAARQNRVQGTVLLSIVFAADGRIANVRVVRGLPDELNDEAVKAANEIVFLPALKNGRLVSVRMSVEYTFNLI